MNLLLAALDSAYDHPWHFIAVAAGVLAGCVVIALVGGAL